MRSLPKSLVLSLFIIGSSNPCLSAENADDAACLSANQLVSQIEYCEHNIRAANSAQACYLKSKEEWQEASEDIALLEKSKNSQQGELLASAAKYNNALNHLVELVQNMQARAEQIEQYPDVMMDDKEIFNGNPSLRCYQDNISKIQNSATDLDQLIIRGLHLIRDVAELRHLSKFYAGRLDNSSTDANLQLVNKPAKAAKGAKGVSTSGSDISKRSNPKDSN